MNPAVATAPESVNVPLADTTVAGDPRVMAPDHVLLLATLRRTPAPAIPVPFNVRGSATVRPVPVIVTAAPVDTAVPVPVPPSAALAWTSMLPALADVAPVYVLATARTSVPAPDLASPPLPLMAPLNVSVEAESVTEIARSAANDIAKLTVFADAAALEVSPPAPSATEFPARL